MKQVTIGRVIDVYQRFQQELAAQRRENQRLMDLQVKQYDDIARFYEHLWEQKQLLAQMSHLVESLQRDACVSMEQRLEVTLKDNGHFDSDLMALKADADALGTPKELTLRSAANPLLVAEMRLRYYDLIARLVFVLALDGAAHAFHPVTPVVLPCA